MNLAAGRFLIPTRLEGSPFFARFQWVFDTVAARLGAEVMYCDDVRAEDLPPDCPFVVPFRPVQWSYSEGFGGLLTLPARIRVFGFWDNVHQGMKGTRWFHRDRRVLVRHFRRADAIITSNRTPFLKWYPRFADKLEHLPMFFTSSHFAGVEFNETPMPTCVLAGSLGKFYPFRQAVAGNPNVKVIPHPGYTEVQEGGGGGVFGADYARELSRYVAAVTCGSVLGYAVAKYFELPAAGCLLLAQYLPDLDLLGYRDGVNYLAVTEKNFDAKLADVLARPEAYAPVRRAGFELMRSRHADTHRAEQLEQFIRARCAAGNG